VQSFVCCLYVVRFVGMSGGGESLGAYVHPELVDCAKAVSIYCLHLLSFDFFVPLLDKLNIIIVLFVSLLVAVATDDAKGNLFV